MQISAEILAKIAPGAGKQARGINSAMQMFNIDTKLRAAHWLAQCAMESAGFSRLEEGLNYKDPARLAKMFRRFDLDKSGDISAAEINNAAKYCNNPQKLANFIYQGRYGNGNEASGDGYKFRGRGDIQVTFLENYRKCSIALFGDLRLLSNPDLLLQPDAAALSAGWYWSSRNLNELADRDDLKAISIGVNGGLHGFDDGDRSDLDSRVDWLIRCKEVL